MDFKKYFKENSVNLSDKEIIAIKVGGLITAARIHSGLSQAELAEKIGTQQPSVARAENGKMIASIEFLYKIAKAIKTDFLFPKFGFMENREGTERLEIINDREMLSPYCTVSKSDSSSSRFSVLTHK